MANWRDDLKSTIEKNNKSKSSKSNASTTKSNSKAKNKQTTTKKKQTTGNKNTGSLQDQIKTSLDKVSYDLQSGDKYFGKISYNAYNAIRNNKLDLYNPKSSEEKNVLNDYKNHVGIQFVGANGKPIGKVSYDGYNALVNGTYEKYKPKNKEEKATLEKAKKETIVPLAIEVDGKTRTFGNVSFNAIQAINHNKLDSYKPVNNAEKKAIDKFKKHVALSNLPEEEQRVFKKYNLNPATFTTDDFEKWALNHGYKYDALKESNADATLVPKYKGFKKVPTKEEQADFKILSDLAGQEYLKDAATKYPKTFAIATVASAPIRETMSIGSNVASAVSAAIGDGAITDSWGEKFVENTDLVRQTITEEYASKWFGGASGKLGNYGALTFNGLMSIGDMVTTSSVTKGLGSSFGLTGENLTKFAAKLTSGLLASNSVQSTILEKKKEGYSDAKAVGVGFATGVAEFITEKFALEEIFGAPGSFIKKGLVSFFAEFIEEGSSDAMSKAADYLIAGNDSAIKRNINAYIQDGKSKKEATKLAIQDSLWETLSNAVVGGFSGVAVGSVYDGFRVPEIRQTGKTVRPIASKIVQGGLDLDKKSEAYKHAKKLSNKDASKISDYELGLQHIYNTKQAEYEQEIKTKKINKEVQKEPLTVNTGDTFIDTKTNNTITVVERNENTSTVELTTATGKTEVKTLPNKTVDSLISDLRYTKVNTSVPKATSVNTDTTVDTETSADNVVTEDASSNANAPADNVVTEETVAVADTPTLNIGDTFVNTKTKDRITVVDKNETHTTVKIITPNEEVFTHVVDNSQADKAFLDSRYQKIDYTLEEPATNETETDNETITIEAETSSAPRDINLVRYGKYYAVYGEEAKEIGANLGINTQRRNINGVETDVLLLPADLAEELAPVVADSYNFIFSDKPSTTEVKNAPVANETVVAEEETSTGGVGTAEERIYDVANAINDTLIPDVKEGILTGMNNKGVDGGLVEFAKPLIRMYRNEGTLNEIANYFTDKGARVIAAIEGRTEAVSEVETTTTPTEIEDTEVVESQTIPEMETADEVVDNAIPTETVADEVVNETETTEEVEVPTNTETKTYVSGNTGTKDGAIIDEIGNNSVVKAIERDKSDVATAMSGVAEQTVEMDKPVEVVYVPDGKGNGVYAAYFAQTKDSRGGQIASVNSVSENANFNNIYDMSFVNETGFMNNDRTGTTIAKSNFEGNLEAVKQLVNNILENKGQTTFTMDDIDVNNFNDVSCALFSEVSKYLPDSIKSKLGFKSQSFGNMPRYIKFGGINSSVNTKNAVNIDHVETASGKYVDVINELFAMDDAQRESVINSIDKMPATVEELNAITENRQAESIDKTTSEVLKNEQKSDTIVEETVTEDSSAVEREDNGNERIRGSILPKNGRRASDESTRKQTGKLSEFKRKNKGKNVRERKRISREIIRNGQVEKVENENHIYTLIKPEAYNDEMLSVIEEAKANGKEVGFFVGTATIHPGTANEFQADGIKISSTKILLQYDGVDSPQLMYKHEHIHTEWNSAEVQEISNTLDESLSAEEKQAMYEQERYAHYKEIYDGDKDAVWQEFVCDTMSGMNDYTEKYIDTVNDYWYGDESVESYNPADYATETDAGGEKITDDAKYSLAFYNDSLSGESKQVLNIIEQNLENISSESKFNITEDKNVQTYEKKSEYVLDMFEKWGNVAYNSKIGTVELVRSGAKSTIAHGFGSVKLTAIQGIKSVIEKGDIISFTENYNNKNIDRYIIAAKGKIDGKDAYIGVVIKSYPKAKGNSKFYLHEAKIIETVSPLLTAPQLSVDAVGDSVSKDRVSQNEPSVKEKNSNPNSTKSKDVRYSISKEQDAAYMKAVESGDMETAQKMVDEVAEKAFSNSKVRGDDGKLKMVYHGTVNDFTAFKREFANIEGDFGKGYYFTSNEYDVDANYANEEGPDLKNKIAHYADKLEWDEEYSDLSYEEREEIARQKFITSEPNTITAYLNMENPVYITPDTKGTFLDFNEAYDEEYDEYGEPEGLFVDFIEALKDNASDYAYNDVNFDFLWERVYDEGGMYASDAVKIIKNNIVDELMDDNGDLAISEVVRLAFEQIGFDGIIDTSVYYKFRNIDGMNSETTHYIVFDSEQIKSAEPVTYDDEGNAISLDDRFNKDNVDFRYSVSKADNLETQKRIESIAEEIGSHEEFIELAKQNTQEFVGKIKENKNLQKRLDNAKRQMLKSPKPAVNVVKVGKITQEILKEVDSTLNAKDLREEITSIYNEYFAAIKSAKGVEAKVNEANDVMLDRFSKLAVDIANSAEAFTESEEYEMLKSYIKNTRIRVPDSAKADSHYSEFRKSHMGTFNLTNDGTDIDVVYEELCGLFPGKFDTSISHPADQLMEISKVLDGMKPYAYNPHLEYMNDVVEHIVNRFASEVDGLAVMPKTKAEKMAEKSAYDKEIALEKERKSFEQKLDKHKKDSEDVIRKLQKKIDDANYVGYWEKRLSKEEKAQAVKEIREKRDIAILKTQIRNIVSDMKKGLYKPEASGGYPKELVQAAAKVLSALDFTTGKTAKDGSLTKANLNLEMLKMEYDALKNNPNYDFQTEYSEELSKKIEKLYETVRGKRVIDLTIDELSNLKDILSEIRHTLSIASRQISREGIIADNKANMEIATDIINSLKLDNKAISEIRNQLLKEIKLATEQGKAFVINPHRIFEMIANYDKNSEVWKLYDQILRGSRDASKFTMDATMPFDELTDGGGNEIAFFDFRTKTHKTGIKYQDGTEAELPKSIICELVMLWDRKQGRRHLAGGGIKIPDLKLFNKGKTAEALASGKLTKAITQSDITRLKGMLDSYDKAWIKRARHLFNKVAKDAINETSVQLVGRELAKSDNFIRIYVDSDFVRKDIGKDEGEITIEGHGSLKETNPDAKNPVVLRGLHENVYDHIDFASKYYGLAIPIRNFNKVYKIAINDNGNFNSVKNALGSVYGPKIRDGVVVQTIKDLQAPRPRELSLFNKVRGSWLNATFFANIRSTLKQTTSYWTSAAILDEDSLAKGLASYVGHSKKTKAEIAKYSGTLYKRAQGLSTTELGDRANRKRLAGASNWVDKTINKYAPVLRKIPEGLRPENWLQSMDVSVSSALWEACKHQVSKTMKATDDGYMTAVRDLYERVIEETQSNYDVLHRPEILKTTNAAWQTVGMFQNDNLQQTGIMYGAFGDLQAKQKAYKANKNSVTEQNLKEAKKRMGKAIRSRIYSSVWLWAASMLGAMLLRKFKPYIDDEEKEITARSVLEQMMLNMSEDMLGVFAPVVGQIATKAMDTFDKDKGYDFISDPAFDALEDFIKATSKIYYAYAEDEDVAKAWIDAIPAISNMTGLPAKNISDLFNAVKGYIGDIKAGEFAHDLTDYTSGNKSFYNYDDLASYIVSGKSEKEKKWREYYSANGKEIAKGSLTNSVKPAYVQLYVDSPQEAYNIKRKLILDYDYTAEAIDKWTIAEYFKHAIPGKKYDDGVVSDPEYASEIANAVQTNWEDYLYSAIRSKYKSAYKKGNADDNAYLREALVNDLGISTYDIDDWEYEVEESIEKKADEQEAEKRKYE